MPFPLLQLSALLLVSLAPAAFAQSHVIAYVPTVEATTTGVLEVSGDKSILGGASVVTALDRTAHVALFRGGELLVCQTSVVHLTAGQTATQSGQLQDPLLISLDRGALEVRMSLSPGDAVMTPDLRFSADSFPGVSATLDLTLRVTPNGDTCVENRGKKAPFLNIVDVFTESAYQLKPGQHVLFEHGSLKEVVDRETSPCGCPPATPEGISLAEAAIRGGAKTPESKPAADPYPFPAAVSQGLAPPAPIPPETPGETHIQVAATLDYDSNAPVPPPIAPTSTPASPPPPVAPEPTPNPKPRGIFHSIGHFFKKIFVR